MGEREKLEFLGGVISGAARTARGGGPPAFRFAPGVYKARLEDFYFYRDRRSTPILDALALIERELLEAASPGR